MTNLQRTWLTILVLGLYFLVVAGIIINAKNRDFYKDNVYYTVLHVNEDLSILGFKVGVDCKDISIVDIRKLDSVNGMITYSWTYEYTDRQGIRQQRVGKTSYRER